LRIVSTVLAKKQLTHTTMNTYEIQINGRSNGTLRAKTAENALVNFLRTLSATHALKRGTIAGAKRFNQNPVECASVYLWQGSFQQPVHATATLHE
jgi:hypothetical protein